MRSFLHLLQLLTTSLSGNRLTPEPYTNKCNPRNYRRPHPSDPDPTTTDLPTPGPLIMCKMSDGDFPFDVKIGQEWAFVIDFKSEYSVLVR